MSFLIITILNKTICKQGNDKHKSEFYKKLVLSQDKEYMFLISSKEASQKSNTTLLLKKFNLLKKSTLLKSSTQGKIREKTYQRMLQNQKLTLKARLIKKSKFTQ